MRNAFAAPVMVCQAGGTTALKPLILGGKSYPEAWLQQLIHDHPACLPVGEIEPAFGDLVSVGMEVPTKHGPIDNLLMTPNGNIVLVEAKLWRNPEARREVVAQALDYASCLFEWTYEDLEVAVLKASFGDLGRPKSLFDLVAVGEDGPAEQVFVDAVNANLAKGRILILVVGDGIRSDAKRLGSLLQSHAGAHFTFALVELAVFRLGEGDDVVVCPRILAQTEMIHRGVVEVLDRRIVVSAPKGPVNTKTYKSARPESITAEQFYEAMAGFDPAQPDKLRAFQAQLEPLGVDTEFQRALILRWEPPAGRPITLGTIHRNGSVWTDGVSAKAPLDLAHAYLEDLAKAFGMEVEKHSMGGIWYVKSKGHAPKIAALADRLPFWAAAIERFITAVKQTQSEREL